MEIRFYHFGTVVKSTKLSLTTATQGLHTVVCRADFRFCSMLMTDIRWYNMSDHVYSTILYKC